jgi:hypothetical protein
MASASGPPRDWATIEPGLENPEDATMRLVLSNLQRLLSRGVMDAFLNLGMHQDLLVALQLCLASMCYLNAHAKDDSYPVQWVFERHRELLQAAEALELSTSRDAWSHRVCTRDLFFQVGHIVAMVRARSFVSCDIEERMQPFLSLPLTGEYTKELNMGILQNLVNPKFVMVCCAHAEGLRMLSHQLLVCVRTSLDVHFDREFARHQLFAFL